MSVFRGNDREIDFEEEDTLAQYPELYEDYKEPKDDSTDELRTE